MDEIESIIQSIPEKWQAYEAVKRVLQQKELSWEEYQERLRFTVERLGI